MGEGGWGMGALALRLLGSCERLWVLGRFPLLRDGRFANRPYGAVGDAGCEGGLRWRCAAPSPLWIPAFAGMTPRWRGPRPLLAWTAPPPCPSLRAPGYRLSPVSRGGGWWGLRGD